MLLPLGAGIFVHERYPREAADYVDEVAGVSNVSLVLLILASLGQNLPGLVSLLGSGALIGTVLVVATAVVGGYLLAIPAGVERRLLSLGSGQRNIAAAYIIAGGSFAGRATVFTVIAVAGVIMMLILFPLAGEWSKRPSSANDNEPVRRDEEPAPV
jgi:predicted Na+-dependent transporter